MLFSFAFRVTISRCRSRRLMKRKPLRCCPLFPAPAVSLRSRPALMWFRVLGMSANAWETCRSPVPESGRERPESLEFLRETRKLKFRWFEFLDLGRFCLNVEVPALSPAWSLELCDLSAQFIEAKITAWRVNCWCRRKPTLVYPTFIVAPGCFTSTQQLPVPMSKTQSTVQKAAVGGEGCWKMDLLVA